MKTITLILIIFSSFIYSQSGWQLIYPGNIAASPVYRDIKFLNEQTGYIFNDYSILKTTNGTQTWQTLISPHQNNSIKCFYILSENIIWAFEDRIINFTTNGGTNWQLLDTSVASPVSACFINQYTGWVCGNSGAVKKTTNSGSNWITCYTGISEDLKSVSFINPDNGVCAGDWGKILSTTNGGANWNIFTDPFLGFFKFAKYFDPQTAFISGNGVNIYRTSNKGASWSLCYVNASLISSINFNTAGTGFAFGTPFDIFTSSNNGITWGRLSPNGLNPEVHSASITPNGTIWIAADSSMILKSSNNGALWNEVIRNYITNENLNSVYFINQLSGFACGDKGVLIKSSNGGSNWYHTGFNEPLNLKFIKFTGNNTGYLCGGNGSTQGIIYKTTNFGISWVNQYRGNLHINVMYFLNSETGWAGGVQGTLLKTTNGGSNWVSSGFTNNNSINCLYFTDGNTGYVGTNGLFKTTNSGNNWSLIHPNTILQLQFIGNYGFAITSANNVNYFNKSTNMGSNWSSLSLGSGNNLSMHFANSETGWICYSTIIRRTGNGGANWSIQPLYGTGIPVLSVHFTDTDHGWVAGRYGGIMKTVSGGIGLTQISAHVPGKFALMQNYPNPFNPVTKIRFSIPARNGRDRSLLKIYDILGREISILVNEELKPGTYEVNWDASNYSSGVYFYSLITNEFTQTKKMVLVK